MNRLRLSCSDDGWYDVWVEISVLTPDFRGKAGYYGSPADFETFIEQLAAFPIDPNSPPAFDAGNVAFAVEPVDAQGHLLFRVSLKEYYVGHNQIVVAIPMTYAGLQDLQRALIRLAERPPEAVEVDLR